MPHLFFYETCVLLLSIPIVFSRFNWLIHTERYDKKFDIIIVWVLKYIYDSLYEYQYTRVNII
jgi:hypothetical protein